MFNNETWWQIGFTIIIGLLTDFRDDPTINIDKKEKFKRVMLKIRNLINDVYSDYPAFQ